MDLQQGRFITGLDIELSHPLIILKDRPYLAKGKIRIDFGQIKITNDTTESLGRIRSNP